MLLPMLMIAGSAQASCPDLAELSAGIRAAIDDVELEKAQATAETIDSALACQSEPVSPLALHAVLVTAGAAEHFQGHDTRATELFVWAAAAAPSSLPDPALGEGVGTLYQTARSEALLPAPASLVVGSGPLWVDGAAQQVNTRVTVTPGPHLVQWTSNQGTLTNQKVELTSGTLLALAGGQLPTPPPVAKTRPRPAPTARWMRMGGTLAVMAGAGFLAGSAAAHQQFDQASGRANLEALQQTVNSRTVGGASLATVGTVVFATSWSPGLRNGSAR